jgi:hypothetical protein
MPKTCYRMRPEFRRSLIYVSASFPFLGGVIYAVRKATQTVSVLNVALMTGVSLVGGLAVLALLHWRICVDEDGLSRRRFWNWDRWNWADFANGRIQKGHRFALIHFGRPWWRKRLDLDILDDRDREQVAAGSFTRDCW